MHNFVNEDQKEVVLVGGGHTHALFLKMWARMPIQGVRLTLISPDVLTPYSGMLPGLLAGHYSHEDSHIDLSRLCKYAGVRFIQTAATGIDAKTKAIHFANRPSLRYHIASINSGATPDLTVPGSAEHSISIKPISKLFRRWEDMLKQLNQSASKANQIVKIAVVGGGAAGVETIQAIQWRLAQELGRQPKKIQLTLFQNGEGLPENFPKAIQRAFQKRFKQLGIAITDNFHVEKLELNESAQEAYRLTSADQRTAAADFVFWCTQARGAAWLADSGLPVDTKGFIKTNSYLQVIDHPSTFACGDGATITTQIRPKAGVFAVRQAKTLYNNITATLLNQKLTPHRSQRRFLSILTGGAQWAIASKGRVSFPLLWPHLIWKWKRSIDQSFMDQFSSLTSNNRSAGMQKFKALPDQEDSNKMRCGGCGAKIGGMLLTDTISQLKPIPNDSILIGLDQPDDCAALEISSNTVLCQSVDVLRSLVDDPFLQGKIAAEHALSDLFAMNARPHSAQAIVSIPFADELVVKNDLQQLMAGAVEALNKHGCTLIGGHTSESAELSVGFCVNGFADRSAIARKSKPNSGEVLILTKPLGTGTLFAAHNQLEAKGAWIDRAIKSMLLSNSSAAKIFAAFGASAITDVTGFGLIGHLREMISSPALNAEIHLTKLPALDGAIECISRGLVSSLHSENRKYQRLLQYRQGTAEHPGVELIFDPQTSGGLIATVAKDRAQQCIRALRESGYGEAQVVGRVFASVDSTDGCRDGKIDLTLTP